MGSVPSVPNYTEKQIETIKIILTGLDGAGKSTILNQLTQRNNILPDTYCPINDYYNELDVKVTTPISGFQIETLKIPWKQLEINCWDVRIHEKIRSQRHDFCINARAVIFVIDSNDWDRADCARIEMHKLMNDELKEVPLLVLANKRDLPGIMNLSGMKESLAMYPFTGRRRRWRVHGICASQDGLGIHQGLDWIISGCPDLLRTKYDLQLLRNLFLKERASIKNTDNKNLKNILLFIFNQPSEICGMIEKYLDVIDNRVTGIEYVF